MSYRGADISKKYFDADVDGKGVLRFPNTEDGFRKLRAMTSPSTIWVIEATGSYSWGFVLSMDAAGVRVVMENPLKVRRFAQSQLRRVKTDKVDATMLTEYGDRNKPRVFDVPETYILQLRQLLATYELTMKHRTALCNQMEAVTHAPIKEPTIIRILETAIAQHEALIEQIGKAMDAIIKKNCKEVYDRLCSIPSIGKKTARVLITLTGDWSRFKTSKAFAAYTGLTPRVYTSGTSVKGSRSIVKLGDPLYRKALYMCALSAIRYNPACKHIYERLRAQGRCKMIALVAVMHKLARQAWAMATGAMKYDKQTSLGMIDAIAA